MVGTRPRRHAGIACLLAQDSPHYARRFTEKIFKAVEALTDHPQIGRKVPEADREDIRELIFQNYRIIYRIKPERLYIVTVLHTGAATWRGKPRSRGRWCNAIRRTAHPQSGEASPLLPLQAANSEISIS